MSWVDKRRHGRWDSARILESTRLTAATAHPIATASAATARLLARVVVGPAPGYGRIHRVRPPGQDGRVEPGLRLGGQPPLVVGVDRAPRLGGNRPAAHPHRRPP